MNQVSHFIITGYVLIIFDWAVQVTLPGCELSNELATLRNERTHYGNKKTLHRKLKIGHTNHSPHDGHRSSSPKPVKLCSDQ